MTLHIYCRTVSPSEENRIIHTAANRNRLERTNTNDLRRMVTAESNLQDMTALLGTLDREHELDELCGALNGCFIDLMASEHHINVLEVKCWDTAPEPNDAAPVPVLTRHSAEAVLHGDAAAGGNGVRPHQPRPAGRVPVPLRQRALYAASPRTGV